MKYLALCLLLTGCVHHTYPHIPIDGLQAAIVRTHACKMVATEPAFSNVFPQHATDQLWDCGGYGKMWVLASQIQPEEQ